MDLQDPVPAHSGILCRLGLHDSWCASYDPSLPPPLINNMDKICCTESSFTWTLPISSSSCFFEILIFTFVLEAADVVVEEQDVKSGVLLSPRKPFLFYVVHGLLFHVKP
ncbi:hypothetical protein OIU76_019101 [Salix suchowensis]|nr:hypothetical protein OIU76_019101 [Salix suchowensis]